MLQLQSKDVSTQARDVSSARASTIIQARDDGRTQSKHPTTTVLGALHSHQASLTRLPHPHAATPTPAAHKEHYTLSAKSRTHHDRCPCKRYAPTHASLRSPTVGMQSSPTWHRPSHAYATSGSSRARTTMQTAGDTGATSSAVAHGNRPEDGASGRAAVLQEPRGVHRRGRHDDPKTSRTPESLRRALCTSVQHSSCRPRDRTYATSGSSRAHSSAKNRGVQARPVALSPARAGNVFQLKVSA